jgi:hypothetical protein
MKPVPEAALGAVRDTLREHGEPIAAGAMTFMQARTANEVLKAQERRVRLQRMKGELVDRAKAVAQVFRRDERDAWVNWPARVAAMIAAELEVDPHQLHTGARTPRPGSPRRARRGAAEPALIAREETWLLLKALRHHPLVVGTAEVLGDSIRYVAIMLVMLLLLGQLAKVAL